MNKYSKIIALIPARSRSQVIKNKNMVKLNKKPLIHYTIHAAKKSKYIDEVYVSSNDKKILEYASSQKVNIINRPDYISKSTSHSRHAVTHFINKTLKRKKGETLIIFLQPTSPLRNAKHIDNSITKVIDNNKSLVSVCKVDGGLLKSLKINSKGLVEPIFSEKILTKRRQDIENIYKINGAIYIFTATQFLKNNNFPIKNSQPFIMNDISSIDIDNKSDLDIAKKYIHN